MEGLISGSRMRMMGEMVEKRTEKRWRCEGWERVNGLWLTGGQHEKGRRMATMYQHAPAPCPERDIMVLLLHILIFTLKRLSESSNLAPITNKL